ALPLHSNSRDRPTRQGWSGSTHQDRAQGNRRDKGDKGVPTMSTQISPAIVMMPSPTPSAIEAPTSATAAGRIVNPTKIDKPVFLLNVPLSYSTGIANNPWMEDLPDEQRKPNFGKAMCQFLQLYNFLASEALVYLLPAPGGCGLQDLVFT